MWCQLLEFFSDIFFLFLKIFFKMLVKKKKIQKRRKSEIFTKLCRNAWKIVSSHQSFVLSEICILFLTKHKVFIFHHFSLFFVFPIFTSAKYDGWQNFLYHVTVVKTRKRHHVWTFRSKKGKHHFFGKTFLTPTKKVVFGPKKNTFFFGDV